MIYFFRKVKYNGKCDHAAFRLPAFLIPPKTRIFERPCDARPRVRQELEVLVRHRPALRAVDVVDGDLHERLEPSEPLALYQAHAGFVVLRLRAAAVRADGVPALDGDDHLPAAAAAPARQPLLPPHGLRAFVLAFDLGGLSAACDRPDPRDSEPADAGGLV